MEVAKHLSDSTCRSMVVSRESHRVGFGVSGFRVCGFRLRV